MRLKLSVCFIKKIIMEKGIIKREDVICMDNYNRDSAILKQEAKFLEFINKITFGLMENHLLFQYDKLLETWVKKMDEPGYFDKP